MSILNHEFVWDQDEPTETPELAFSEGDNFDRERQAKMDDALLMLLEFN